MKRDASLPSMVRLVCWQLCGAAALDGCSDALATTFFHEALVVLVGASVGVRAMRVGAVARRMYEGDLDGVQGGGGLLELTNWREVL